MSRAPYSAPAGPLAYGLVLEEDGEKEEAAGGLLGPGAAWPGLGGAARAPLGTRPLPGAAALGAAALLGEAWRRALGPYLAARDAGVTRTLAEGASSGGNSSTSGSSSSTIGLEAAWRQLGAQLDGVVPLLGAVAAAAGHPNAAHSVLHAVLGDGWVEVDAWPGVEQGNVTASACLPACECKHGCT